MSILITNAAGTSGSGTVTSVALTDGSSTPIYTISGSPVTTAGTLTFTLNTESANLVFAGPTTGAATQPTFRSLVTADLPASIAMRYENRAGNTVSNSFTVASFATQIYDANSTFTSNTTFTAPTTGIYHVDAQLATTTSYTTAQALLIKLFKNTSTQISYGAAIGSGGGALDYIAKLSADINLTAGDTLQIQGFSSTSVSLITAAGNNYFNVHFVR